MTTTTTTTATTPTPTSTTSRFRRLLSSPAASAVPDTTCSTVFHSRTAAPLCSLEDWATALQRVARCDDAVLLVALVLAGRYAKRRKVTAAMVHRLYAACFRVALKMYEDHLAPACAFAEQLGMRADDLLCLETELLFAIDWRTVVTQEALAEAVESFLPPPPVPLTPPGACLTAAFDVGLTKRQWSSGYLEENFSRSISPDAAACL
jgi:hypothetical protein